MMQRTDRHFRFLVRQLSRRTLLYTEMVVMGAILRGERSRFLDFDASEHPLALQIGGDDPASLAECARIATDWGYDEINLNIGCPSDKVQSGNFGVCLMAQPERVAACVTAMKQATSLPVTVKHRIGFDDLDRYEDMLNFVDVVTGSGADRFTVHARKAWLQGLSPKENRNVPPLRHGEVYRLKAERPALSIEINGGARTLDEVERHLAHVDAVMVGRGAWDRPGMFARADSRIFGDEDPSPSPEDLVDALVAYAAHWLEADPNHKVGTVVRPCLNLFAGQPGSRQWRRVLSDGVFSKQGAKAKPEVFWEAWEAMVARGGRPQLAAD
jgi:tRNA-dihydrouridine synthase A